MMANRDGVKTSPSTSSSSPSSPNAEVVGSKRNSDSSSNSATGVKRRPIHYNSNPVWMASVLSESGCLSLGQILGSFSAPISEEHAWAVTYETVKTLDACMQNKSVIVHANANDGASAVASDTFYEVTSPSDVLIHQDGFVSTDSFLINNTSYASQKRRKRKNAITTENKAIVQIGLIIYTALDFGLREEEERHLTPQMERLLDLMTSADSGDSPGSAREAEPEDEGIEQDQDEDNFRRSGICQKIFRECEQHLALGSEAESHYKAVCRALVSESLEVTSFMEKIKSQDNPDTSEELKELAVQDWARLWVQVLRDMRTGVKLKKVEFSKTPIEYEMTPYEMLMDDIRLRRYKLNKVMVDGDLPPSVKKDAHDVILDFIRSRPPLKPATDRKLPPQRKESTPVELLMEDIRNSRGRSSLRKTAGPPTRALLIRLGSSTTTERSRTRLGVNDSSDDSDENDGGVDKNSGRHLSPRRKVTVDPSTMSHLLNFSDTEDDFDEDDVSGDEKGFDENNRRFGRRKISVATLLSRQTSVESTATLDDDFVCYVRKQEQSHQAEDRGRKSSVSDKCKTSWKKKLVHDLALHGEAPPGRDGTPERRNKSRSSDIRRRNSVSVCETPTRLSKQNSETSTRLSKQKSETPTRKSKQIAEHNAKNKQEKDKINRIRSNSRLPSQSSIKSDRPKKIVISASLSSTSGSTTSSASTSRASSRSSTPTRINSPANITKGELADSNDEDLINKPQMHANLHAEFMQSEHWATALQTLDLTLDEVVHIRSVLTKAELEGLPLDGSLKEDVEKGKVCFLCMKSRFGFFSRGQKCELCKQQICNKCAAKMRIPLEHFSTTPVFALGPNAGQLDPPSSDHSGESDGGSGSNKWFSSVRKRGTSTLGVPGGLWGSNTAGSAPTSPVFSRKFSSPTPSGSGPTSCFAPIVLQKSQLMTSSLTSMVETEEEDEYAEPSFGAKSLNYGPGSLQPQKNARSYFGRSKKTSSSLIRERLEGSLQTVCIDCREMVLQVIRAQTTARRLQMAKSFFQNLNNQ